MKKRAPRRLTLQERSELGRIAPYVETLRDLIEDPQPDDQNAAALVLAQIAHPEALQGPASRFWAGKEFSRALTRALQARSSGGQIGYRRLVVTDELLWINIFDPSDWFYEGMHVSIVVPKDHARTYNPGFDFSYEIIRAARAMVLIEKKAILLGLSAE